MTTHRKFTQFIYGCIPSYLDRKHTDSHISQTVVDKLYLIIGGKALITYQYSSNHARPTFDASSSHRDASINLLSWTH